MHGRASQGSPKLYVHHAVSVCFFSHCSECNREHPLLQPHFRSRAHEVPGTGQGGAAIKSIALYSPLFHVKLKPKSFPTSGTEVCSKLRILLSSIWFEHFSFPECVSIYIYMYLLSMFFYVFIYSHLDR